MAAIAPYEGAVFVPGTAEEVGVELLKHVDDPQLVVAYAGYGFWAPAGAVRKVKGAKKQDVHNGPIAPNTASYVEDDEYPEIETTDDGVAVPGAFEATEPEANAGFPDQGVGEKAAKADYDDEDLPEKTSKPFRDVGVGEKATKQKAEKDDVPEKISAQFGDTDGKNPATNPAHDATEQQDDAAPADDKS